MHTSRWSTRDLALVATFAALIAALGLAPPLYPFGIAVPITAQTLGVMLAGSVLGARRGAAAVVLFLLLVLAGLPLLSGGRGGAGVFVGPSAGYLVGWVLGAFVTGFLVERRTSGAALPAQVAFANAAGGILAVYLLGVPVSAWVLDVPMGTALVKAAVYLPGDAVKVAVSTVVTLAVLRGYPGIVPDRRVRQAADGTAR